ncbi:hypothetical protein O1C56_003670 [Vibrio cholerae]|nr:hypothetical protein [Vibrio cholerae]
MSRFMLGETTLLDSDSPEYFWIKRMLSESYSESEIKQFIVRAFGGDEQIAEAMLDVVKGNQTRTYLLYIVNSKNKYNSIDDKKYKNFNNELEKTFCK